MKRKVWDITVKDNPNRVVMGENDEFYTTDTEAYLVFNLDDKNFNPATAVLTLENRNDGSLKNETVDVVDGLIEWEMPQRYIEHFGNWQGQLVYEDTKDGQPELYTSAPFSFVVNAHIGDKKKPSLVEIENWEKFIREGTVLIETWEDLEALREENERQREANEEARQANYNELVNEGLLQSNIDQELANYEAEYAPRLTELEQNDENLTTQLAQTEKQINSRMDTLLSLPEGSTTNDARLEDIKVGVDGTVYDSPGSHVRSIADGEGLSENSVKEHHATFLRSSANIFNPEKIIHNGYYSQGWWQDNENFHTAVVDVKPNTQLKTNIGELSSYGSISFWGSEVDDYISYISPGTWGEGSVLNVPAGAKIMTIPISASSLDDVVGRGMIVEDSVLPSTYIPYYYELDKTIKISSENLPEELPATYGDKLLIVGDSISETATVSDDGSNYQEGTRSNWPRFVMDILNLASIKNYAKSGASYKNRNLEPRQFIGYQIQQALDNNEEADIIVVSAGTNDGRTNHGDFETAMSKNIEDLDDTLLYEAMRLSLWTLEKNFPDAVKFIATPIQRADREPIPELSEAIVKMGNRYNFVVINAENESGIVRDFEVQGGEGRYLYDGLHPNIRGQQQIARLYSRVILSSLNY